MGCDDVKRILYFFLDGALGESKRRVVNDHLRLCPDCERRSRVHRKLRELVQKRLGFVAASQLDGRALPAAPCLADLREAYRETIVEGNEDAAV